jgi:hypothetical protein
MNPVTYGEKRLETSEPGFESKNARNTLESLHGFGGFGVEPSEGENASDADRLLAALACHPWRLVWCRSDRKAPFVPIKGAPWIVTDDRHQVRAWLDGGRNVGLVGSEETELAILDIDDPTGFADLVRVLGPLGTPTVHTASGKVHFYVAWEPGIPGTVIGLHGEVIGEPRRGGMVAGAPPRQQMGICPPSRYAGGAYRFAPGVDLTAPLPRLPDPWRRYFARMAPPRALPRPGRPLSSGTRDALTAAALRQPGARQRGDDVKFQCPACVALGRDTA